MKPILLSFTLLTAMLASCNGQPTKTTTSSSSMTNTTTTVKKEPLYDIHGLVDPGIGNMVAFALKTPHKWGFQQSFNRAWNGATPIAMIHIMMTSPDSASSIEYLPTTPYYYADGPTTRNLRQTAAQMGMPQQNKPGEMQPMQPLDYMRYVLMPQLQQYGYNMQVSNQQAMPYVQKPGNTTEARAYVDGSMNGKKIRVECVINVTTTNMNGEVYYNWSAMPAIIQTTGDIEACYNQYKATQNSVVFNPVWQQENSRLANRGNAINSYYDQKDFNAVKDFRDYQNNLHQQTRQDRQESARRQSEAVGDVLAGKQKYEDAGGNRATLEGGYNHVYKDRTNTYVLYTNTPLDAGQVDWQELQRVETTRY